MAADRPVSERCTATSKRTGKRCGQLVPGGGICRWHGRNGAAERNRQVRVALAEARDMFAGRYEARHWTETLPAAAALADQLMQAMRDKIETSGQLLPSDIDALAQLTERVARLAKLCQDSNLDERRTQLQEAQSELVATAIENILADLGLSLREPRVMQVVSHRLLELSDGGAA